MSQLPAQTALVVIDVQKAFDDPQWGPRNNSEAEANIARLIAFWRETGQPIFHVHHDSRAPSGLFYPGTLGNTVKPEAKPLEHELVFHKNVNSGFIGTSLEPELRAAFIDTLCIVGLTTQHCVSTTTRMAGNLGFKTYVVSDATATFDQLDIHGRIRPADEVHIGALSDLNGEFASIVTTAQCLAFS